MGTAITQLGPIYPEQRDTQDVLNFYLKRNPQLLLTVSSRWNFLPSSACLAETPKCPDCSAMGILILHSADGSFHRNIDLIVFSRAFTHTSLNVPPHQLLSHIKEELAVID
ncbi:unnamed protein product, partial [Meganyctiphanes norvegica]